MQDLIKFTSASGAHYGQYDGFRFRIYGSKVTITTLDDSLVRIWKDVRPIDDKLTRIVEFIDFRNSYTSFIN